MVKAERQTIYYFASDKCSFCNKKVKVVMNVDSLIYDDEYDAKITNLKIIDIALWRNNMNSDRIYAGRALMERICKCAK